MIRAIICLLAGHVDHGKSKILENIASIKILEREAGGITQTITAIKVGMEDLKKICTDLLGGKKISTPGLLLIDTPGHAAFTNLRRRGGNLADIAILVIDINEGIKPQTQECFEILKQYKTPFIIALNKTDLISGWKAQTKKNILQNIQTQPENVKKILDTKLYDLVGKLHNLGLKAERFDRVEDYTKQIAIIPCSAKTGEGIPELVMVIIGLSQKFLEQTLKVNLEKPAKATVLEVKEEKGLGTVLDIIIYDGKIKEGDTIIVGTLSEPIVTKVKALFETEKKKIRAVKEIRAAASAKISAPNLKGAISGMPIAVATKKENIEEIKKQISEEIKEVIIETEQEGIVVKADSLGSLEAITNLLKNKNIPIKRASIGEISKKDLTDASAEKNPLNKVILGFNTSSLETRKDVKIICHDIIYKIIEDYEKFIEEETKKTEAKELEKVVKPCKIKILRGCIFRQNNPAVVGVEILNGILKNDTPLIKLDGSKIAKVKSMQLEGENINQAEKEKQVAISLPGITVGRQIKEEDILLSDITEEEYRTMKKLKKHLTLDEIGLLKEIAGIKRREKDTWGI